MIGAIIGDIVGSRFEWNNIKTKEFEFLTYTRERKHFLCMREDYCRKARKDWP